MPRTLAEWLDQEMQRRRHRSLQVLARELGVDPVELADWMDGKSRPDDRGYTQLAAACTIDEVELHKLPRKAPV